jgi:hypothetical protein
LHFVALLDDPPTIVRFTPEKDTVAVLQGAVASPPDDEKGTNDMMMMGMMGGLVGEPIMRVVDDGEGNPYLLLFGTRVEFFSSSSFFEIQDANLHLLWSPVVDERFPSDVLTVVGPVRFPEHGTGLIVVSSASMTQNVQRHFLPFSDPGARVTIPGPEYGSLSNLPIHPASTLAAPATEMLPCAVSYISSYYHDLSAYAAPGSPAVPSPTLRQYPLGFMYQQAFHSLAPNNNWTLPFEIVDQQGKRVANVRKLRSSFVQFQRILGLPHEEDVAWIQINYGARTLEWNGQTFSLEAPGSDAGARLFDGTREISDAVLFVLPDGVLFAIEIGGGRMPEVLLYRLEPMEAAR